MLRKAGGREGLGREAGEGEGDARQKAFPEHRDTGLAGEQGSSRARLTTPHVSEGCISISEQS